MYYTVVAYSPHLTATRVSTDFLDNISFQKLNCILFQGVIKGMIGEITDDTNSADAFALLHVPWTTGYSFGFVLFMKLQSWSLTGYTGHS
jgi:hypothetical protein